VTPAGFVAHLLAFHLAVPEPVAVRFDPGPAGFDGARAAYVATIYRQRPGWRIDINPDVWALQDGSQQRLILAHEVCHAVWDHDVPDWGRLPAEEARARHLRVARCALEAIARHRKECRD
jgi:hypothetical protein